MELAGGSIRLVKAQHSSGGSSIARTAEVEFPPEVYRDGQIFNPTAFGKAVKEAIKTQLGGAPKQVALSVGGQGVLVRRVGLPKLKKNDLRHLMETQGDQWIPFLREGAAFDLRVVNPNAGEHQQEVLLVAVPTRYIDYATSVLKTAGLKLAALDVDVSAVYRAAVAHGAAPAQGTVAVLDLSQEKPRLGLFHDGILVSARSLDTRINRSGAGMVLPGFGDDLPVEVRRSVELMFTPLPEGTLLSALVVNDPVRNGELLEGLEREITTTFQDRLGPSFRLAGEIDRNTDPRMALSFGLALTQTGEPQFFDLMPRPTVAEKRQSRLVTFLTLFVIAALGAYGYLWSLQMPALAEEQAAKQTELTKLQEGLARESQIAYEEQKEKMLQPLIAELNKSDPWVAIHAHLKELLPPGVKVTGLSVSAGKATFSGTAPKPDQVAELMNALDKSPYFLNPILSTSGSTDEIPANFSISVELATREVKGE